MVSGEDRGMGGRVVFWVCKARLWSKKNFYYQTSGAIWARGHQDFLTTARPKARKRWGKNLKSLALKLMGEEQLLEVKNSSKRGGKPLKILPLT